MCLSLKGEQKFGSQVQIYVLASIEADDALILVIMMVLIMNLIFFGIMSIDPFLDNINP